ncbi:Oxo-4-hydroxy-4-carboxy-5-ureidoimidazoline decarboxylase [Globomyces pollinis-pini]|nr:Oxo-4-hydroxy-4-carboxy-5-ureidoimidazoline decarboxylase [Globomyces pollinis-pini]
MVSTLPTINQLNSLNNQEFIQVINTLFETAPPLANALLGSRPFQSYMDLIDRSDMIIKAMNEEDQILVVNAHPRIGAPAQTLSALSAKEQGTYIPEETLKLVLKQLEKLNQTYEDKFGFKFVVFVNGRSRVEIVKVLETRLLNSREHELRTGLSDMILIAKDRLSKLQSHL